jgi:pyridoxamine 5'-phosphate oxidase
MKENIASLRNEYALKSLNEKDVHSNPIIQFNTWWKDTIKAEIDEPNAMTLSTASADGLPSARIVLLKEFNADGFVFYTNYESYKASQLQENPKACLLFFWKELERQVKIIGLVSKITEAESRAYFNSRPDASKIGALVSPQSKIIESRSWLDEKYNTVSKQLAGKEINCPEHWGGYIVKPVIVEFWQGRPGRLHDRLQYTLDDNGDWVIVRLAP